MNEAYSRMEKKTMDSSSTTTSIATVLSDQDLLTEILKRSISMGGRSGLQNRMIFSSVCSSWRSVANNHPYKQVPWLMLSKLDSDQETRSFFGLDEKKIHEIKLPDDANSSWCGGSSEGWLVMSHKTSGTFLYNPITGDRINLPRYYSYVPKAAVWWWDEVPRFITKPSMYITKAIVVTSSSLISSSSSTSPPSNHRGIVAVAAIFAEHEFIGFCQPGDKRWQFFALFGGMPSCFRSLVGFRLDRECNITDKIIDDDDYTAEYKYSIKYPHFADVILCRGALYALTHRTAIIGVFKFDTGTSRVIRKIQWLNMLPMKLQMRYISWNYLVESCDGELLMIVRRRRSSSANDYANGYKSVRTWRFLVFKLDESSNPMKWVRIKSLGDQILFLGTNHSKSIRASDIPGARSGNCIYFTAEYNWCHLWARKIDWPTPGSSYPSDDTGVFYLEDGRFETISRSLQTTDEDLGDDDLGTGIRLTFPSTIEYPPIFITPNPSSSSSSFTITHDNHNHGAAAAAAAAARDLYSLLSSSKCLRYAAISIFLAGTATIVLLGTGLDFLKSSPPLPPMPESSPPIPSYYCHIENWNIGLSEVTVPLPESSLLS